MVSRPQPPRRRTTTVNSKSPWKSFLESGMIAVGGAFQNGGQLCLVWGRRPREQATCGAGPSLPGGVKAGPHVKSGHRGHRARVDGALQMLLSMACPPAGRGHGTWSHKVGRLLGPVSLAHTVQAVRQRPEPRAEHVSTAPGRTVAGAQDELL